jgi:GTPase SAR1 family protein
MIAHSFEIKILLLGNVSAGKTTVLNALFRDKFGEVSMKRTTAGSTIFASPQLR